MKTHILRLITVASLVGSAFAFGACAHEGPAERGGRHLDNAARDVKHDLKK
jgi:hypothetical protein